MLYSSDIAKGVDMDNKRKFPWKQNLLKMPDRIQSKIIKMDDNIVVASVIKIRKEMIDKNMFSHIGILLKNGKIEFPNRIIPNGDVGRYSAYNVKGREIKRIDLPKYFKTWEVETPNYGDWYNGSHDVELGVWTYPKDIYPPRFNEILIELINDFGPDNKAVLKFQSSEVLNKNDPNFLEDLLFNLNFIQENTGSSDVYNSDSTRAEFLKTIQVEWEILPPGEKENNIAKIISGIKISPEQQKAFEERYDFLMRFNPKNIIKGTSGFQRYFGALFTENLVVFENISYGNAIYVMYNDWETLSKKSRVELLDNKSLGYDRIIHNKNWKRILYKLLNSKLEKKIRLSPRELK